MTLLTVPFLRMLVSFGIVLLCLSACSVLGSDAETRYVTATPNVSPSITLVRIPTATQTELTLTQSDIPTALPSNTPARCTNVDLSLRRTRYDVAAILDWNARNLQVEQTIFYRNDFDESLDSLVFQVEPNRLPNVFALIGVVDLNGKIINGVSLEGTRLKVPMIDGLRPGCETSIKLIFSLKLPHTPETLSGRFGYMGYSDRQINLGQWLAGIGLYEGNEQWYTPEPSDIGEQTIPESADYHVNITVDNSPVGLQVAGPGRKTRNDGNVWTFELEASRDFSLSLSNQFEQINTVRDDVTIELYYVPSNQPQGLDAPAYALDAAADAFVLYNELFGAYPYERLVIVEGDFPDGMEFTGIVFVSEAWFRLWKGSTNEWLTLITVHEISHQWWYGLVGNDQADHPYLDEMLATYSELLFFERYYPDEVDWWWNFRIYTYETTQPIDLRVYDFDGTRPYINAVYLRAVKMIETARNTIGDIPFFVWLNQYAGLYRNKIATPFDFWSVLSLEDYIKLAPVRQTYLREPNVLGITNLE